LSVRHAPVASKYLFTVELNDRAHPTKWSELKRIQRTNPGGMDGVSTPERVFL